MKKLLLFIFLLISVNALASPPNRPNTYTSGTTISSVAVTGNEVPLYSYLQAGVDTYKAGSITSASISPTAGITYSQLNLSGGILPGDINTTTTSSVYQFENLLVPSTGSISLMGSTGTYGQTIISTGNSTAQWGIQPYLKFSNTQTQNTAGGTATSGSWLTYPLNTEDQDTASIGVLSSNQIILPTGTYQVNALVPFNATQNSQIRLYNVTGSAVLLNGSSITVSDALGSMEPSSYIKGQFTVSGSTIVALQYQVSNGQASTGLGVAANFGAEVYGVIEFTKIA